MISAETPVTWITNHRLFQLEAAFAQQKNPL